MEQKIRLNTGDGQVSIKTDKIVGKLDSLIMSSNNKVTIIIESELGYLVFKKADVIGVNHYPIRARTIANEENLMDVLQFVPFNLNEGLIITLLSSYKNRDVDLILRFDGI